MPAQSPTKSQQNGNSNKSINVGQFAHMDLDEKFSAVKQIIDRIGNLTDKQKRAKKEQDAVLEAANKRIARLARKQDKAQQEKDALLKDFGASYEILYKDMLAALKDKEADDSTLEYAKEFFDILQFYESINRSLEKGQQRLIDSELWAAIADLAVRLIFEGIEPDDDGEELISGWFAFPKESSDFFSKRAEIKVYNELKFRGLPMLAKEVEPVLNFVEKLRNMDYDIDFDWNMNRQLRNRLIGAVAAFAIDGNRELAERMRKDLALPEYDVEDEIKRAGGLLRAK